jgi:ABC-2 type transport system permease protein
VIWLVARREIRERVKTRIFKIGTLFILAVVAAAVIIPAENTPHTPHGRVGVIGTLTAVERSTIAATAAASGISVHLVAEPSLAVADARLRSGALNVVLVGDTRVIVDVSLSADRASATSLFALDLAQGLGLDTALEHAGIAPDKVAALAQPVPLPVTTLLVARRNGTEKTTALYGIILMFVLLTQYGTWILMGSVEEKSSRVVEVLLATLRPVQLLAGKVLGIGAVAMGQGALLVAVALVLAEIVGSPLISGNAAGDVVVTLLWLLIGYAFYCWVYAAAGALAERQEHIQSLAFPLQLPILFGYIVSLTALSGSSPSTLIDVLAYLPPTAPFAMTVLVAFGTVAWWQVVLSMAITIAATFGVAQAAALIYQRAVLRSGRVKLRDVLHRA